MQKCGYYFEHLCVNESEIALSEPIGYIRTHYIAAIA